MSEQELGQLGRLRRAVNRLMDSQYEASEAANRGLDFGGVEEEENEGASSAHARLEEALVDVRDILEGAAEDVRRILGDTAEE
jgi:hypothetical protein